MTRRAVVACTLVVLTTVAVVIAQTNDPTLGTWKLNAAKSKFSAGTALKSGTVKVEQAGMGRKVIVDGVQTDGNPQHWEYTSNLDGKDSPIAGNNPFGDTAASTRVDQRTTRTAYKKGGKVTVTQTSVVSPDGKTRTVTGKGTNAMGQAVDTISVWDKQ
jgi:hypothetical protein